MGNAAGVPRYTSAVGSLCSESDIKRIRSLLEAHTGPQGVLRFQNFANIVEGRFEKMPVELVNSIFCALGGSQSAEVTPNEILGALAAVLGPDRVELMKFLHAVYCGPSQLLMTRERTEKVITQTPELTTHLFFKFASR